MSGKDTLPRAKRPKLAKRVGYYVVTSSVKVSALGLVKARSRKPLRARCFVHWLVRLRQRFISGRAKRPKLAKRVSHFGVKTACGRGACPWGDGRPLAAGRD